MVQSSFKQCVIGGQCWPYSNAGTDADHIALGLLQMRQCMLGQQNYTENFSISGNYLSFCLLRLILYRKSRFSIASGLMTFGFASAPALFTFEDKEYHRKKINSTSISMRPNFFIVSATIRPGISGSSIEPSIFRIRAGEMPSVASNFSVF